MTIYRVHPDIDNYQILSISTDEVLNKLGDKYPFHIDPSPHSYSAIWRTLDINFHAAISTLEAQGIPNVSVDKGRLFTNESAFKLIETLISNKDEALLVNYDSQPGYIINVRLLAEDYLGVDTNRCKKNIYGDLESIGFIESKMKEAHLFRTEYDDFMGLYCSEEFKTIIEENNLSGITFSPDLGNIFPATSTRSPLAH